MTSYVRRCRSTPLWVKICCGLCWSILGRRSYRNWVKVWDDTARKCSRNAVWKSALIPGVKSLTESRVFLADGVAIPSRTLVWTAGTVPSPIIASLPCAKERGRLLVNEFLRVPGWPNVWAVGDCAFVPDIRNPGSSHPPTAQHAIREGKVVAHNIAAILLGRPLRSFSFTTIGLLASIGRRIGGARVLGFNFSGFFAWWMWRTVYLSKLPGLDKKVRVAFDWTLDLLFPKDVCAVHDLDQRRDFHCPDRARNTSGNDGDHETTARRLIPARAEMA